MAFWMWVESVRGWVSKSRNFYWDSYILSRILNVKKSVKLLFEFFRPFLEVNFDVYYEVKWVIKEFLTRIYLVL